MSDNETVTQLMKNGLSPSENRIRLLIEKNLDAVIAELSSDFQAAINATAEAAKLITDNIKKQATADFQALTARIEEVEKRQQYEAERARLQAASTTPNIPVSPSLVTLKIGLDKTVPAEKHEPLFKAMNDVLQHVDRAKTTAEVQRLLYRASDEACRYAGKRGPARSVVHFEKKDVILSGAGLLAAGVAAGVVGTVTARAVRNRRSAKSARVEAFPESRTSAIDTTAEDVSYEVVQEA